MYKESVTQNTKPIKPIIAEPSKNDVNDITKTTKILTIMQNIYDNAIFLKILFIYPPKLKIQQSVLISHDISV